MFGADQNGWLISSDVHEQPGVSISRKTVSFGGARSCRFRAFLSKSSITGSQVHKTQSVLLPKMGGVVDCDGKGEGSKQVSGTVYT